MMIIDKVNINVCALAITDGLHHRRRRWSTSTAVNIWIFVRNRKIRAVMLVDLLIGLHNRIRKWAKNYGMKAVKTA